MNSIRRFWSLYARPLSALNLLWFLIIWAALSLMAQGSTTPDEAGLDSTVMVLVILPGTAGFILGLGVHELQASSFAFMLPSVQRTQLWGFLATGLIVVSFLLLAYGREPTQDFSLAAVFALGAAAYCLGGAVADPLSARLTAVNVVLFIAAVVFSRPLAWHLVESPGVVCLFSTVLSVHALARRFGRQALRERPLSNPKPQGLNSTGSWRRYERKQLADFGASGSRWRTNYLGTAPANWLRAAWYETYGRNWTGPLVKSVAGSWGLVLIVCAHAWLDRGDMDFASSLAWAIHEALLWSPHLPQIGDREGLAPLLAVVVLIITAQLAWFRPVALSAGLHYPVSRRLKAQVALGGSVLDAAILLVVVAPLLWIAGHGAGLLVGIPPRFDYMPFFLRALLISMALMPFAYAVGLVHRYRGFGAAVSVGILMFFGMILLLAAGGFLIWLSPRLFPAAPVEMLALVAVLVLSRLLYARFLLRFFRDSDLRA